MQDKQRQAQYSTVQDSIVLHRQNSTVEKDAVPVELGLHIIAGAPELGHGVCHMAVLQLPDDVSAVRVLVGGQGRMHQTERTPTPFWDTASILGLLRRHVPPGLPFFASATTSLGYSSSVLHCLG